jgi:hypothetical protein
MGCISPKQSGFEQRTAAVEHGDEEGHMVGLLHGFGASNIQDMRTGRRHDRMNPATATRA